MAIIMLINSETFYDGLQYLNDVVGVFAATHQFSETELTKFNFLTVNGSVEDVKTRLKEICPQIENVYKWVSDNEYHFTPAPDGDDDIDSISVFRISNKWFRADNDFRFPVNIGELTAEEKQLLETVDINDPAVDSFISKLAKDITALSGNDVEIKELRNSTP